MSSLVRPSMRAPSPARIGTIVTVNPSEGSCECLVQGGPVGAYYGDQVAAWVTPGALVTLLPVGNTYEIVSTRGGSGLGIGAAYGPELLPNVGFEAAGGLHGGPAFWDIEWAAAPDEVLPYSMDTTPGEALGGTGCVRVAIRPRGGTHILNVIPASPVFVDPTRVYKVSAWVRADTTGQGATVTLRTYTAAVASQCRAFGDGVSQLDHATVTNPGTSWTLLTNAGVGSLTIPPGHQYARVALRTDAPDAASVTIRWDTVSMRHLIAS